MNGQRKRSVSVSSVIRRRSTTTSVMPDLLLDPKGNPVIGKIQRKITPDHGKAKGQNSMRRLTVMSFEGDASALHIEEPQYYGKVVEETNDVDDILNVENLKVKKVTKVKDE